MINSFIPLIQQVIIGSVVGKSPVIRLSYAGQLLKALSCLLALVGLFLVIYSEYLWLGIFLPPYFATFLVSVTIIMIAVGIGIWGDRVNKKQSTAKADSVDITTLIAEIISSLDKDLEGAIRTNPKIAMALSTLGGFIAGKK